MPASKSNPKSGRFKKFLAEIAPFFPHFVSIVALSLVRASQEQKKKKKKKKQTRGLKFSRVTTRLIDTIFVRFVLSSLEIDRVVSTGIVNAFTLRTNATIARVSRHAAANVTTSVMRSVVYVLSLSLPACEYICVCICVCVFSTRYRPASSRIPRTRNSWYIDQRSEKSGNYYYQRCI